jgi:hypothetical protein
MLSFECSYCVCFSFLFDFLKYTPGVRTIGDLPWIWVDLAKLHLMGCDGLAIAIEDQKSGAGRPLID